MPYRPDLSETLARYAEAWTTADPDARWSLVHACAATDVVAFEPGQDRPIEGQAALAAALGVMGLEPAPFEVGPADGHHDRYRVRYRRGGEAGLLVVRADRDHRLAEIVRFVDG